MYIRTNDQLLQSPTENNRPELLSEVVPYNKEKKSQMPEEKFQGRGRKIGRKSQTEAVYQNRLAS
jgi:DNA relaxase NicK